MVQMRGFKPSHLVTANSKLYATYIFYLYYYNQSIENEEKPFIKTLKLFYTNIKFNQI